MQTDFHDSHYDALDAIALGLPLPAPVQQAAPAATPAAPSAEEQALQYALAKQVPDMVRGFTITTAYGDIAIPAGWAADFIADQVRMALKVELLKLVDKASA